jgi:hypothetical protein
MTQESVAPSTALAASAIATVLSSAVDAFGYSPPAHVHGVDGDETVAKFDVEGRSPEKAVAPLKLTGVGHVRPPTLES